MLVVGAEGRIRDRFIDRKVENATARSDLRFDDIRNVGPRGFEINSGGIIDIGQIAKRNVRSLEADLRRPVGADKGTCRRIEKRILHGRAGRHVGLQTARRERSQAVGRNADMPLQRSRHTRVGLDQT